MSVSEERKQNGVHNGRNYQRVWSPGGKRSASVFPSVISFLHFRIPFFCHCLDRCICRLLMFWCSIAVDEPLKKTFQVCHCCWSVLYFWWILGWSQILIFLPLFFIFFWMLWFWIYGSNSFQFLCIMVGLNTFLPIVSGDCGMVNVKSDCCFELRFVLFGNVKDTCINCLLLLSVGELE